MTATICLPELNNSTCYEWRSSGNDNWPRKSLRLSDFLDSGETCKVKTPVACK